MGVIWSLSRLPLGEGRVKKMDGWKIFFILITNT